VSSETKAAAVRHLLRISDLKKHYPIERGVFRRVHGQIKAVDGVDLHVDAGETLGLVGESGCGKTTLGRCILRAIEPTSGAVHLQLEDDSVNLTALSTKQLHPYKKHLQMIFQDPYSSLDPRMTVLEIVAEPIRINDRLSGKALEDRVAELLRVVGMDPRYMRRYPHAFSGGQRQRIGIARALALNPRIVVADEAVSALDVSIQAQILNLLKDLQGQFALTYIFIAHDLSVVEYMADRVAVMYVGKIVEIANKANIYNQPRHPYTEALLSAIPRADPETRMSRLILPGEAANPAAPPPGCAFHPRCIHAQPVCAAEVPALEEIEPARYVRCHRWRELSLRGNSGQGVLAGGP
jgi:peptide/nickel transport system ATP-binding protein